MTAAATWDPDGPGVMPLPSGRLVRGRGLGRPLPPGPRPDFGLYLVGKRPPEMPWETLWVRWTDFWLPSSHTAARRALGEAWERAAVERVELACQGGRGRTGTALACLATIDGVPANEAVAYVREHYREGAVEMPWQKHYVRRFPASF
ncbi:protein phosphatase [Streptomyces solicathayae]|uniref:Protein phosphatase n=1 Tax=Streptomyces solicathayae TaxID=3081768 RepID=A0ABZ0LXC0_9ACTN|nr:protein phosphatase [Streptomyces sp. HUAS YS2]WOX23955.1 protein phosphatase [Streptomyces sp. HUAS YS2]